MTDMNRCRILDVGLWTLGIGPERSTAETYMRYFAQGNLKTDAEMAEEARSTTLKKEAPVYNYPRIIEWVRRDFKKPY